jgi:hypothetical protein
VIKRSCATSHKVDTIFVANFCLWLSHYYYRGTWSALIATAFVGSIIFFVVCQEMENKGEAENCPVDVVVKGGKSSLNDASTVPVQKEKCIAEAAAKVVSAPALPVLKERNIKDEWKRGTPPNPVKVPPTKLFSYADSRYMSPTDSMVSPVTRGLWARTHKPMSAFPPWAGPPKV